MPFVAYETRLQGLSNGIKYTVPDSFPISQSEPAKMADFPHCFHPKNKLLLNFTYLAKRILRQFLLVNFRILNLVFNSTNHAKF